MNYLFKTILFCFVTLGMITNAVSMMGEIVVFLV